MADKGKLDVWTRFLVTGVVMLVLLLFSAAAVISDFSIPVGFWPVAGAVVGSILGFQVVRQGRNGNGNGKNEDPK